MTTIKLIKEFQAISKAERRINKKLEELREENTRLNHASNFYMTHEIAVASGQIHGLKIVLDEIRKAKQIKEPKQEAET